MLEIENCHQISPGEEVVLIGRVGMISDRGKKDEKSLIIHAKYQERTLALSGKGRVAKIGQRMLDFTRQSRENYLKRYPGQTGYLFQGLVFGIDDGLPERVKQAFTRLGQQHAMSASGYNVSLLASLLERLEKKGQKRKVTQVGVLFAVTIYLLFSSFSASLWRAVVMFVLARLGQLAHKPILPLYNLLMSCLLILLVSPGLFWHLSFQLSVLATTGILLLGEGMKQNPNDKQLVNMTANAYIHEKRAINQVFIAFFSYSIESVRISYAAQLLVVPYLFWKFGQWQAVSILASLLLGWMLPWLTVGSLLDFTILRFIPVVSNLSHIVLLQLGKTFIWILFGLDTIFNGVGNIAWQLTFWQVFMIWSAIFGVILNRKTLWQTK